MKRRLTRREMLGTIGATVAGATGGFFPRSSLAQGGAGPLLAATTGLEHIGFTVPDTHAASEFYGRIFNPQLFREREDENRLYVTTGTAYLAFGGNDPGTPGYIDHFCALMEGYNARETRPALEAAGVALTPGGFGMLLDPDQLRLQLLNVPGGLAGTIMPAGRISLDPPAVHAVALDSITLQVSNLDRSVDHYRKLFGREASRDPRQARFDVASTQLVLEPAPAGATPRVDRFCLTVVGFDRAALTRRLGALGVELAGGSNDQMLVFRDPYGIGVELKPA